jgi:DNA-binding NarL/FixJ family response regulator
MDKYRVLILDDEPLIRSLMEEYFKTDERFITESKEDGRFILQGNPDLNYDLLVFDVLMPNVNGIEVLQNVKSRNPKIKTIAITGMANDNLIRQIKELDCNTILKKPIKRQEFMDAVYKELNITT